MGEVIVDAKTIDIAKNNVLNQYIIENANLRVQIEAYKLEMETLRKELEELQKGDDHANTI